MIARIATLSLIVGLFWGPAGMSSTRAQDGSGAASEAGSDDMGSGNQNADAQLKSAQGAAARAGSLSKRITSMMNEARADGDIIRVTCLNSKLTEVNAAKRSAEQRLDQLNAAIESRSVGDRNHAITVLNVINGKLSTLEQQSNQCVGADVYETGKTKVTTENSSTVDADFSSSSDAAPVSGTPNVPPVGSRSV